MTFGKVRLAPGVSLPPFLVSALCMPAAKHEFMATWKGEDAPASAL
jgi:hypothetical protein